MHEADVHGYCCRVNLVLVGAEGVVENGGIINKLGSYHVAIAAKEHGIPFYVAAESYKVLFNSSILCCRILNWTTESFGPAKILASCIVVDDDDK